MVETRSPLAPDDVAARLRARFGADILGSEEQHGHAVVTVGAGRYHEICAFLRDDPSFDCNYADFTGAVDRGEDGFELITHVGSIAHGHQVRVKVKLPAEEPVIDTVSDLFPTCDWHERETAEMFGIRFEGHPQPVRLLLPEPFEGHPLRKDFVLMSREAKPWPGGEEDDE